MIAETTFTMELDSNHYNMMFRSENPKTMEARQKNGYWKALDVGMTVYLVNSETNEERSAIVIKLIEFKKIRCFLENCLPLCLPDIETVNEGIKEYERIFGITESEIDEAGGIQGIVFEFIQV